MTYPSSGVGGVVDVPVVVSVAEVVEAHQVGIRKDWLLTPAEPPPRKNEIGFKEQKATTKRKQGTARHGAERSGAERNGGEKVEGYFFYS